MKKKGAALLIVVIIMSIVFMMAAIMVDISIKSNKVVRDNFQDKQAYYCAESGINTLTKYLCSNFEMAYGNGNVNPSTITNLGITFADNNLYNDNKSSCNVDVEAAAYNNHVYSFNIKSTGIYTLKRYSITVVLIINTIHDGNLNKDVFGSYYYDYKKTVRE